MHLNKAEVQNNDRFTGMAPARRWKTTGLFQSPIFHAGVLFLLAVALRFFHLDKMSFWVDEVATVLHVSFPIGNIYQSTLYFSNPPLFHYLVKPFYLIFGRDDFWLRVPCAFLGAMTIPILYFILRRLLSARAGIVGAVFLALSPFHIWFSQEFRMYTLLALEGLLSLYFWLQAKETDSAKMWWSYAIVSIAGLYTHYWFPFFIAAQVLWVISELIIGKRYAAKHLLVFPIIMLSYIPWVPGIIRQVIEDDYSFLVDPIANDIWRVFQAYIFGLGDPFGFWSLQTVRSILKPIFYYIPVLLPILGAFWPGNQRKRFIEIYLVGLVIPFALVFLFSMFVTPIFVPSRYTMLFFPAYVLSVARLTEIQAWWPRRQIVIVALAWLIVAGVTLERYYFEKDKASGKMLWSYIRSQPGAFRICNEFLRMEDRYSLNYYAGLDLQMLWQVERIPSKRRLARASYDMIVPMPVEYDKKSSLDLPTGWIIKSRQPVPGFDIIRLTKSK